MGLARVQDEQQDIVVLVALLDVFVGEGLHDCAGHFGRQEARFVEAKDEFGQVLHPGLDGLDQKVGLLGLSHVLVALDLRLERVLVETPHRVLQAGVTGGALASRPATALLVPGTTSTSLAAKLKLLELLLGVVELGLEDGHAVLQLLLLLEEGLGQSVIVLHLVHHITLKLVVVLEFGSVDVFHLGDLSRQFLLVGLGLVLLRFRLPGRRFDVGFVALGPVTRHRIGHGLAVRSEAGGHLERVGVGGRRLYAVGTPRAAHATTS
mmetsp:Transcript_15772/g.46453  ORF Transcript_15772/g.46453 Transcript_15772/m.46453 type:complete len:265 (+) Transcript_15772:796-1590(+)